MTYKEALATYEAYIVPFRAHERLFLCRGDFLFKSFRTPSQEATALQKRSGKLPMIYLAHLFLALVSVINLLAARRKGLKTVHYLIDIDNTDGSYDFRSGEVLELLPPEQTLNLLHVSQLKYSLRTVFKKHNAVFFESFYEIAAPFLKKRPSPYPLNAFHHVLYSEAYYRYRIVHFLFRWVGIKRFVSIDDSRYTNEMILACNALGIPTLGYQHGRFNQYHVGLFEFPYDRYLVWSKYFKSFLLNHSDRYGEKNIEVVGHFRLKRPIDTVKRRQKILWIGESNIDYSEVIPYIESLLKRDYSVVFRGKPGNHTELGDFLTRHSIILDHSETFFKSLQKHGVGVVVGTHSTALMESWLAGVPSFAVQISYDYGNHLWENGLIPLCPNEEETPSFVEHFFGMDDQSIGNQRKKIWGETYLFQQEKVRNLLEEGEYR